MTMRRECGDCQLCCKLVPVSEIAKGANQRCQHQKAGKGCKVYQQAAMPISCHFWNCRWLTGDGTQDLRRPDRSRYVIDLVPDHITVSSEDGLSGAMEVVQIWCDPMHPHAHRDPALRAYLARLADSNIVGLVRTTGLPGFVLIPPSMSGGNGWIEHESQMAEQQHTFMDTVEALQSEVLLVPPRQS